MAETRALPIKTKEETDVLAFKINNNDPADRNAPDFNPDDFADQRVDGEDDIFEVADVTSALVEGAEDHEDMLFWDANAFDWNNNELKDVKSWGKIVILPNDEDSTRKNIESDRVFLQDGVDDEGFSEAVTGSEIVFTNGSSSEDEDDSALETDKPKFYHKEEKVNTRAYLKGAFEGSLISNKLTARDAPILEGNTSNMFKDCTSFNYHFKNWDFSNVIDSVGMFDNTAMTQDVFRKNLQRMKATKSDEVGTDLRAKVIQYIGAQNVYVNGETLRVIDNLAEGGQVVTNMIVLNLGYGTPKDVWTDSQTYKISIPIRNMSNVPLNVQMSANGNTSTPKEMQPRETTLFEASLSNANTQTGSRFTFQFQGSLVTREDAPSTDILTMVFEVPASPGGEPPTDDKELITWDEIEIPWNTTKYTWDGVLIPA